VLGVRPHLLGVQLGVRSLILSLKQSTSNYRHKNFPRRFSSILRLFTGMEIDIEIVDNDPAVPDIVYPVRPEDLP